jgi:hypothetical protein
MVTVDILAALICFSGACHPALVGKETPKGVYRLELLRVVTPVQFGGSVLAFKETQHDIFAIHRTWPGRENRYVMPAEKRVMTLGCINVEPQVYEALVACCTGVELKIE